jgi:hypothetical protein
MASIVSSTILFENYKFDFELDGLNLNIKLTETAQFDIYEGSVKESDIYVKPIKKFYSMIEKSLSREPNYNIVITEKKGQLNCSFAYNTEMIDIEETITFTKVNTQKTKEIMLVERIKELTELSTPVFGYRDFGERMIFNLDSRVLDFRPFDDFTRYPNFSDYNKFTKAKKIIMSTDSSVLIYSSPRKILPHPEGRWGRFSICNNELYEGATFIPILENTTHRIQCNIGYCRKSTCCIMIKNFYNKTLSQFNHPSVYMPSVTEVEVYCSPNDNLVNDFTKFGSLPNLEKLVMIQKDNTGFTSAFLDIHNMITTTPNKKLKHIILKDMSTWIIQDTIDKAKLFAQVNNIRLEII